MENVKTETLSLRIPADLKTEFLEIFNQSDVKTKPELFKELLKKYKEPVPGEVEEVQETDIPPSAGREEITETKDEHPAETEEEVSKETQEEMPGEITEKIVEESREPAELEISVKLNPIQVFAIRETILNEGFKETVNKLIDKVDNAKDTSFFGNSLYSGAFKGVFTSMDLDETDEESINKNMGIALVNQFMSGIVIGAGDMLTPVTRNMIKEFIREIEEETE